jgi:4-oxalocrotonate tautomerase family enzyme
MPAAQIFLLKGHERTRLKNIIRETTDAMSQTLGAPKDRLMIWISEIDGDLWGLGGIPASELEANDERKAKEIPFVQMILMEGRPTEQLQKIMAQISEIIARNLEMDINQIRVRIALAQPELWSIGGVPASVSRAKELEARRKQMASI